MTFTDDDLKRLKDTAYDYRDGSRFMWIKGPEIEALLARLEEAEKIASYFSNHPDSAHWWPYAQNAIEAWRKATGK